MRNDLWDETIVDILEMVIPRCKELAGQLKQKIADKAMNYRPYPIYDTGKFIDGLTEKVYFDGVNVNIVITAKAEHSKYIFGGSWYGSKKPPIAPLESWIKRKRPSILDKDARRIAFALQYKIFHEGIKERPLFNEVKKDLASWMDAQIRNIEKEVEDSFRVIS